MALYFQSLIVWQKAFLLAEKVYILAKKFPKEETYALGDQVRRAAVSVSSNIAEWSGRWTINDRNQFYHIAKGSAMEVQTHILLARKFWYIEMDEQEEISSIIEEIVKMLVTMTKK